MTTPTTAHRTGPTRSSPEPGRGTPLPAPLPTPPPSGARPRRPLAAVAVVAGLALLAGCAGEAGPGGADPADGAEPSGVAAAPDPSTTTQPSPTGTATPGPSAPAPEQPVLHVGGTIGDHGVDAPQDAVVPYLTDLLGAEPRVEGDGVACETNALPGRRLVWDGLTVLVRTTDESDAATEPYVAGWMLDERFGASAAGPLSTAAGVGLGDREEAVVAAYPQGQRFEAPDAGASLWVVGEVDGDHTDDLVVRLADGVATAITGGFGCGE